MPRFKTILATAALLGAAISANTADLKAAGPFSRSSRSGGGSSTQRQATGSSSKSTTTPSTRSLRTQSGSNNLNNANNGASSNLKQLNPSAGNLGSRGVGTNLNSNLNGRITNGNLPRSGNLPNRGTGGSSNTGGLTGRTGPIDRSHVGDIISGGLTPANPGNGNSGNHNGGLTGRVGPVDRTRIGDVIGGGGTLTPVGGGTPPAGNDPFHPGVGRPDRGQIGEVIGNGGTLTPVDGGTPPATLPGIALPAIIEYGPPDDITVAPTEDITADPPEDITVAPTEDITADPPEDVTVTPPDAGNGDQDDHHSPWPWIIGVGPIVIQPISGTAPGQVPVQVLKPIAVDTPVAAKGADLELVDLQLIDAGIADRNLGPRYRVFFRNRGNRTAGNFQVTLVASMDQQFSADLPHMMVDVEGVNVGEKTSVTIRLPITAMAMPNGKSGSGPFKLLTIVLDPNQMVDELNEENNAAMVERTTIKLVQ